MYTITLNDGSKIEGFTLKNNCLVTAKALTERMLAGKLNPVTISGTKGADDDEDIFGLVGTHTHMDVAYLRQEGDKYILALSDIPAYVWNMAQLKANQDFIAMMTGVQI